MRDFHFKMLLAVRGRSYSLAGHPRYPVCASVHRNTQTRLERMRDVEFDCADGPPTSRSAELTAEQRLCAAVLKQAISDAQDPHLPEATRAEARAFLCGDRVRLWCEVGGLNPRAVHSLSSEVLDEQSQPFQFCRRA
jgi:hypothetical protein